MRITPEQVVEAYKATGLKPMQGDYFPEDGCACAMGAIARMKFGCRESEETHIVMKSTYGELYSTSFGWGFDKNGFCSGNDEIAYTDGQAAWQACVDAGLVEVTSDASD